jgi:hypothetical protein
VIRLFKHIILALAALGITSSLSAQVLPSFGNSRTGSAGMQFLKTFPDARSASMGGAYSASAFDVSALYWNVAGITKVEANKWDVAASQTLYFGGVTMQNAGVVFHAGKRSHCGFSVQSLNYGDIKETDEFHPSGTGRTFTISDYTITGAYAKQLTENFRFGIGAKWAHEGMAGVNTNNILFDLGILYEVGVRNARFAVTLSNFGVNARPDGTLKQVKFSGPIDVTDYQTVAVPGIFRLGFAFDLLNKNDHIVSLAGQLNHYTDNNETFSLGAEYGWRKILFFRSGYEFGVDEGGAPSAGFGLNLKRKSNILRIDYGYANKTRLGNLHRITLGLTLPSYQRKAKI